MVEHDNRVFWALQGVLLGALALLAGLTLQREGAMDKLNREMGEIRGLLVAVGSREATFEEKVHRMSEYIQGVPKKCTFRMLLEPQCTGSITSSRHPLCLGINFLVVSY